MRYSNNNLPHLKRSYIQKFVAYYKLQKYVTAHSAHFNTNRSYVYLKKRTEYDQLLFNLYNLYSFIQFEDPNWPKLEIFEKELPF